MSLKDELAKEWGQAPPEEVPIEKPKEDSFAKELKSTLRKPKEKQDNVSGNLERRAREAQLNQEILKAEQLEYKIKQEQIKLEKETGNLIEYEMAEFLFFGFMKKTNMQLLTLIKKIEPDIKNLCQENEPAELLRQLQRSLEAVITDIQNQQKKDIKDWKKNL